METPTAIEFSPIVLAFIFAAACYILTFLTRRVVEAAAPKLKLTTADAPTITRWWNDVILFSLGPVWGVVIALCVRTASFVPPPFDAWQVAIVVGLVAGFLSGFLYRLLKKVIASRAGQTADDSKDAPPVPGD